MDLSTNSTGNGGIYVSNKNSALQKLGLGGDMQRSDALAHRTWRPEAGRPTRGGEARTILIMATHNNQVKVGVSVTRGRREFCASSATYSVHSAGRLHDALLEIINGGKSAYLEEESGGFRSRMQVSDDGVRIIRSWNPKLNPAFAARYAENNGSDLDLLVKDEWRDVTKGALYLGNVETDLPVFLRLFVEVLIGAAAREEELIEPYLEMFVSLADPEDQPDRGIPREHHKRWLTEMFSSWDGPTVEVGRRNRSLEEAIQKLVARADTATKEKRALWNGVRDQLSLLARSGAAMALVRLIWLSRNEPDGNDRREKWNRGKEEEENSGEKMSE